MDPKEYYMAKCLLSCVEEENYSTGVQLLQKGASPDALLDGVSAFHIAVGMDNYPLSLQFTKLLLAHGAQPNVRSEDGITPLHIAAAYGRYENLQLLLEMGGDPSLVNEDSEDVFELARQSGCPLCMCILGQWRQERGSLLGDNSNSNNNNTSTCGSSDMSGMFSYRPYWSNLTQEMVDLESTMDSSMQVQEYLNSYDPAVHQIDVTSPDHPSLVLRSASDQTLQIDLETSGTGSYHTCSDGSFTSCCVSSNKSSPSSDPISPANDPSSPASDLSSPASDLPSPLSDLPSPKSDLSSPKTDSSTPCSPSPRQSASSSIPAATCRAYSPSGPNSNHHFSKNEYSSHGNTSTAPLIQQQSRAFNPRSAKWYHRNLLPESSSDTDSMCSIPVANRQSDMANLQDFSIASSTTSSLREFMFDRKKLNSISYPESELSDTAKHSKHKHVNASNSVTSITKRFSKISVDSMRPSQSFLPNRRNVVTTPSDLLPRTSSRRPSVSSQVSSVASSSCSRQSGRKKFLYHDKEANFSLLEVCVPVADEAPCDNVSCTQCSDSTLLYDWKDVDSRIQANLSQALSLEAEDGTAPECTGSDLSARSEVSLGSVVGYNDTRLRRELGGHGVQPGPTLSSTRRAQQRHLVRLRQGLVTPEGSTHSSGTDFLPEVVRAVNGQLDLSMMQCFEAEMCAPFANPDPSRHWREGVLKYSFNYLLLDPRVTSNLPARAKHLSEKDAMAVFIKAVFYVGKGKRSRPYGHFKEAISHLKNPGPKVSEKVRQICDIWAAGQGVVALHLFQSVIPVEAYTREGLIIDALGLKRLTNVKGGERYGPAATWPLVKRRGLGAALLRKAFHILLMEGERQIHPHDIRAGQ